MTLYILFESPIGYALFKLKQFDDVSTTDKKVQKQIQDFESFSTIANLHVSLNIILRDFTRSSHLMSH